MSKFYVTCAQGLAPYVKNELNAIGIDAKEEGTGVTFSGEFKDAYNACLWVRCGSRVLLELKEGKYTSLDQLYNELSLFSWSAHLRETDTFSTKVTARRAGNIHTHFAALRVKDAIVDYFNELMGTRPNVDVDDPDVRFYVHIFENRYTLYLDMSGEPLHKRGFRSEQGAAPIKENLAAALLYRSNWPEKAANHEHFIDPLCGAGTILIEAALMARDIAPGLYRNDFGFMRWRLFKKAEWDECYLEAKRRAAEGEAQYQGQLVGIERSSMMIGITKSNADRARVLKNMVFKHMSFQEYICDESMTQGLIVTNPPYGERLGEKSQLVNTYMDLGDFLRQYEGFEAGVITSDSDFGRVMGIRARKINKFWNGALGCIYLQFNITKESFVDREKANENEQRMALDELLTDGGEAFMNRLVKNYKHLARWASRQNIEAYRVYDADIPEFNVAIDLYKGQVVIYEYEAPSSISKQVAEARFEKVLQIVPHVFEGILASNIHVKQRARQRGRAQYERHSDQDGVMFEVHEGAAKLLVNLTDYLDTGLFLDHRDVRFRIGRDAKRKRFLNLFCYTGSASVHAANGGASETLSVDLSRTYLSWADQNLALNGHFKGHELVQADVLEWLKGRVDKMRNKPLLARDEDKFELIFMDPPTFSNSKKMEGVLDIQRDHSQLIIDAMRLLMRDGELLFSTNLRGFKMDQELVELFDIKDISSLTLPEDFKRNPKIRQCFSIKYK
ncbi:bifunctional 23S rRNA (guanine(2069)-N(7))-methyltransferase RlmK/23S rRNA (guanine(2445)-N(2))-methyltransferase RlmL [Ignatzschineria rhizosphaerae]|uniref:Ribosomal RNA large subunit methyltransferase K/L n=1 Tax=Ignatzschineria rhizosphaerae TaxID=2923279 RepID=A0ABY3WYG2_9GAMM|nr:bifunctional 23S rRNA (guanine(2069)-N(7))-methyltransferase RlmK/23S rRNA (guanine(2445)-N(2))-methyltransferase RlmL [Ignatzschineria rhizosphaerae]UNM95654.1 bifunctional 23S rRNA (guanine(2069)-N(7))-methyltransferase RlmK/23S rRNA (guanine(2445)-N(2))-methyltransferase RlmL [Ignatzschineria rhizosphaerae]